MMHYGTALPCSTVVRLKLRRVSPNLYRHIEEVSCGGLEGNENTIVPLRSFPIAGRGHAAIRLLSRITKASAGSSLDDFFRCDWTSMVPRCISGGKKSVVLLVLVLLASEDDLRYRS